MTPETPLDSRPEITTLEAFADTIIPGRKRSPDDLAVAGVSHDDGAVAAGAVQLLCSPAVGLAGLLESAVEALNEHAQRYATARGQALDPSVPPFVALSFLDRTALVDELTGPDHPERQMWVALTVFSNMAFDTGAHLHTAAALAAGHPGLVTMGFARPEPDGLWRFPDFSYGRAMADLHPDTTPSGSPA